MPQKDAAAVGVAPLLLVAALVYQSGLRVLIESRGLKVLYGTVCTWPAQASSCGATPCFLNSCASFCSQKYSALISIAGVLTAGTGSQGITMAVQYQIQQIDIEACRHIHFPQTFDG
jgi:hypothetical protein